VRKTGFLGDVQGVISFPISLTLQVAVGVVGVVGVIVIGVISFLI